MDSPPDVEAYLTEVLAGVGAVRCWAVDSAPRIRNVTEATTVQIDTRASSKERASDLAHHARALLLGIVGQPWHDGIVLSVDEVMGPSWLPDSDGAPRYIVRATITYRAHRSTEGPA